MLEDIDRILISRETIARRVREIAQQITHDLCLEEEGPPAELTLVPILTGSLIFVADLIRELPLKLQLNLVSISSYSGTKATSRGAAVEQSLTKLPESMAGTHVLVIDDILDSGNTLRAAIVALHHRQPASIRTCVLLRKQRPEAMAFPVDYVCFDIPDVFVVGYGLDYNGYYRNLPDIVTLRPEVFRRR